MKKSEFRKKAQTSVEVIIVSSIIFIILLVTISMFITFPSIAKNGERQFQREHWSTTDVAIKGLKLNTETLYFAIQNNLRYEITINNITFDYMTKPLSLTLSPGEISQVNISFYDYEVETVTISYTNNKNNQNYVVIGNNPIIDDLGLGY